MDVLWRLVNDNVRPGSVYVGVAGAPLWWDVWWAKLVTIMPATGVGLLGRDLLDSLPVCGGGDPAELVEPVDEETVYVVESPTSSQDDATFIGIYAYGMRDPGSYLSSKGVHDGMHLAAGRGFDRHGEWAATLAEISFILNVPGVPDEIKNRKASEFFVETIDSHFDIDEVFEMMPNFSRSPTTVLDMQKVLDKYILMKFQF